MKYQILDKQFNPFIFFIFKPNNIFFKLFDTGFKPAPFVSLSHNNTMQVCFLSRYNFLKKFACVFFVRSDTRCWNNNCTSSTANYVRNGFSMSEFFRGPSSVTRVRHLKRISPSQCNSVRPSGGLKEIMGAAID